MARDSSPPDSPLSSMASTEAYEEEDGHDFDETASRPSKRQKVEAGSTTSSAVIPDAEPEAPEHPPLDGLSDVSSDTSGDIPSSPPNARLDEEDFQEQVTKCEWDGCQAEDHKDMDDLVKHIHDAHIESRQKKYTCEWMSCTRKGMPHASGYALKAHMRSHTREKPFYCYLPECDRSFTRSDALAKHMRTVHETDALKPSDPSPKSTHGASSGKSKLKIIIKRAQSQGLDDSLDEAMNGEDHADLYTVLSKDLFSEEELAKTTEELYRKCYWESKWAEEIGESLKKECQSWEDVYHKEWLEKEALVAQVIDSEIDWHTRRQAVLAGVADVQITAPPTDLRSDADAASGHQAADDERSQGSFENGLLRPNKEALTAEGSSRPASPAV